MKKHAFPFFTAALCRAFAVFILLTGAALPLHAAGLSLSQVSITNTYTGTLTLTITGLDSVGQAVIIEEYLDVDGSGTINAGDALVRKYTVTDGQVTSIGGQRNLNVPGDDDLTANGTITTHFTYGPHDIIHLMDGVHIFRVSPSGTGFAPVTQNLTVTQQNYAGSGISGQVLGSSAGQAHAIVMLRTPGGDGNSVALTLTDASGNFSIKAAPGSYQILPAKNGFVYDLSTAPTLAVPAGSFLTGQTQTLTPGNRTITGKVRNATTTAGVPGFGFQGQSQTGWAAITLSDGSGNFVMDATAEAWQVEGDHNYIASLGLLRVKATASSGASITGFNVNLPQATALIYGSVKTPANAAVPFVQIQARGQSTNDKASTITDANGNYVLNALADSWNYDTESTAAYLFSQPTVTVNTAGTATLQNVVAYPVTTHLIGTVKDRNGNPIVNPIGSLSLNANTPDPANPNGQNLGTSATADANGNFDLGVFGGTVGSPLAWNLNLQNNGSGPPFYISGNPSYNVVDGVNQTGITFTAYAVGTHLMGTVKDRNGNPIPYLSIGANAPDPANPNGQNLGVNATANEFGNFDLVVFGGTVGSPLAWNLYLQNNGSGPPAYISGNLSYNVVDGVNQTGITFTAYAVSTHLMGTVKDRNGNPIPYLSIGANAPDPANPNGQNLGVNATANEFGNFDLGVFGGTVASPLVWNLFLQNNGSGPSLYISGNPTYNVVDGVNPTGLTFTVYPVTAHLTGRVLDQNNNPVPNIGISAWLGQSRDVQSNANVDDSGNFNLPVFGGTWNLGLFNFNSLTIIPQNYAIVVVDGVDQGSLVFRAFHSNPPTISGTVKGPTGVAISGVSVFGRATTGGNGFSSPVYSQIYTDNNGVYSFPAFASATAWEVGVDSLALGSRGFQFMPNQSIVVGAAPNYTVNFVATTRTIYTVTPGAGPNGGVSPNTPQSVGSGDFVAFTATMSSGYVVNQWTVDGNVAQTGGGQFTINHVTASHNVQVTFKTGTVQTYAVNPLYADGNGFISPNIAQVVSSGGNATFTATPNGGYVVNQWTVDGSVAQIGGTSFTITNVTDNHQLGVSFQGTVLTPQSWRQAWYSTTANSGNAADTADPYHRGISNLAVLAFFGPNLNPALAQVSLLPPVQKTATNLTFSFTQPAGVSGLTYGAEWTASLSSPNWQPMTHVISGSLHTFSVVIGANVQLFLRLTVTEQ